MKLTVHEFLTMDGVMQGPGSPDEDTVGGFDYGGWQVPFTADEDFGRIVGGWFDKAEALLFGRTTYTTMRDFWSQVADRDDLVAGKLNGLPKHVVTTTLTDPGWTRTSVIGSRIMESVRGLKERPGGELQVHGSWRLVRTLHDAGLVDRYRLMTFPVVLGNGKRLFDADSTPSGFTVLDTATTASGAVYQELEPAGIRTGRYSVDAGTRTRAGADRAG